VFQDRYAAALAAADVVALSAVYRKENDPLTPEQMLSTERLITDLCARNVAAWSAAGPDDILERLARDVEPGDVVVCMSNGSFGNLPRRLLERLARRSVARAGV
jgi:UDP-N-acetylmuramate: L-alanyl-gamma-D-glutamyl-meso-diaminopimelate ligase